MSCPVLCSCRPKQIGFVSQHRSIASRRTHHVRAGKKWDDVASDMIDKYMGTGDGESQPVPRKASAKQRTVVPGFGVGNGVILLLVINYVVFALSQLSNLPLIQRLPLYSANTHWWSFVTYAFCHADFNHLANNMFMLLVFGRSVEEDEGAFGVLATYVLCGIGIAPLSFMSDVPRRSAAVFLLTSGPRAALVGASGSVFGLFVVSVLSKLSQFNLRRLVEILAIAPFVYGQIMSNAAMQLSGASSSVSYIAHLGGAATGFLLVALLALLPSDP